MAKDELGAWWSNKVSFQPSQRQAGGEANLQLPEIRLLSTFDFPSTLFERPSLLPYSQLPAQSIIQRSHLSPGHHCDLGGIRFRPSRPTASSLPRRNPAVLSSGPVPGPEQVPDEYWTSRIERWDHRGTGEGGGGDEGGYRSK